MGTNRTKRGRNRRDNVADLTGAQRDSLLHGHDFFGDAWKQPGDRRKAWGIHRAGLLAFWLQDPDEWLNAGNRQGFGSPAPGGAGTRPAAWWDFDATEPLRTVTPAEQIALEIEKRGEAEYLGTDEHPQSYFYTDEQETSVEYLRRLKLLTKDETAYLKRLSKDVTDWYFLQRNGWLTAGGRRQWFQSWCRSLTAKGIASARLDLQYLARLGLSPIIPRHDMGPESERSALWQLADMVIITD